MNTIQRNFGFSAVLRMAAGLAVFGLTLCAAEAKQPSWGNRGDSRDDQDNAPRGGRNGSPGSSQPAPQRDNSPPSRASRQEQPRNYTPPARERSAASDMRRSVAASDDTDKGQPRGRSDRAADQPARRSPPRDAAPTRTDSGTHAVERQAPARRADSGVGNAGERTKATDVRARFEKKSESGAASTPVVRDRKDAGGKDAATGRVDRDATSKEKPTLPSAPQEGRSKADDVRRRLDKPDSDKSVKSTEPRDATKKTAGPDAVKAKDGKAAVTNAPRPRPTGDRSQPRDVGRDAKNVRFAEQVKSGKLDHLTKGETATKLKLGEQYRMYGQGDVARRLHLESQAHDIAKIRAENLGRFTPAAIGHPYAYRPNFYHGMVSPAYQRSCLQFNYWGPSFFVGLCWYPHWTPWVEWSWHHHHHAYWDPRPIWCRPVIYAPAPMWVYYEVPVWTPLPEVPCGTWVDLKPAVMAEAASDLQLVAVRFVDPGHPEEKLGPRYRVWFRNNGARPITQPFNVVLFAGKNEQLAANLPQAGVRVASIEANDTQSVDIRLPIESLAMGRDAQGKPVAFSMLHALVDAQQEIREPLKTNNGARIVPTEILPVDPAAFEVDPGSAKPGTEVILAGEGLGPEPGQVLVHVNGKELQAEIQGWYDLGIRWTLPKAVVAAPTEAEVIVVRGDGAASNPLKLTITP